MVRHGFLLVKRVMELIREVRWLMRGITRKHMTLYEQDHGLHFNNALLPVRFFQCSLRRWRSCDARPLTNA